MRLVVVLVAVLGTLFSVGIVWGLETWSIPDGQGGMSGHGYAALILGAFGTLALGAGLMALVFFSSRRGYDDAVSGLDEADADR